MTHLSEEDYLIMQQRMSPAENSYSGNHEADEGPESKLAARIREWAKERGYLCLIHPGSKKLSWFIPKNYVDVVLTLPYGITLYLELKSAKGHLRAGQKLMAQQFLQLGHQWHQVRSWKRFLEIISKILTRE